MKSLLLGTTLAALALCALPAVAAEIASGPAGALAFDGPDASGDVFDRRGRGRGRGGDSHDGDRAGDDNDDDGHGGRPRIPGGSGCDDPEDVIEHPECRV